MWVQQHYRYKNSGKSNIFVYTNNEYMEIQVKTTITFKISPMKMKYLGISLMKHIQDLYVEDLKMLI